MSDPTQPAPADPPEWPPIAPAGTSTSTAATPRLAGPDEGSQRWVPPVDGACPDGYPVKANDNSGIYHVPGGRSYERTVPEKGRRFLDGLEYLKRRHKMVGDVDGLGLALRMGICEPSDSFTPSKRLVDMMVDEGFKADLEAKGRRYGLVLDIGGYYKNVVTLAPSLHISNEEIDLAIELLDQLMTRVARLAGHA